MLLRLLVVVSTCVVCSSDWRPFSQSFAFLCSCGVPLSRYLLPSLLLLAVSLLACCVSVCVRRTLVARAVRACLCRLRGPWGFGWILHALGGSAAVSLMFSAVLNTRYVCALSFTRLCSLPRV